MTIQCKFLESLLHEKPSDLSEASVPCTSVVQPAIETSAVDTAGAQLGHVLSSKSRFQ